MSTTTSNHMEQLTELMVAGGTREERARNRNRETIDHLIRFASILTSRPSAPVVQSLDVRLEQPFPPVDGVENVRGEFEDLAHALRRAGARLAIDTTDPRALDFRWSLGDLFRIDWTVSRDLLGPEPFLCTTCDGAQRVGRDGEHCPDCDHGYFELVEVTR